MLIDKRNLPMVAMDFMNDVHAEDVDVINDLFEQILEYEKDSSLENEDLINEKFKEWYRHTVEHFEGEQIQMEEKGFPPYPVHKGEHDYALKRMRDVFTDWQESKDIMVLKKYFIEELPAWLIHHIQTMDTVTAMFLKTGLSPCSAR